MKDYDIVAELIEDELEPKPHILYDMNYLYHAFKKSMKGSSWKSQPQKYENDFLCELAKLSTSLKLQSYHTDPTVEFVLRE